MDSLCSDQLRAAEEELSARRQEVNRAASDIQKQTERNHSDLEQQQEALQADIHTSQQLVQDFLQEELQHDIPTGNAPLTANSLNVTVTRE